MGPAEVIEGDIVDGGLTRVLGSVLEKIIIRNFGEVVVFEIVQKHGISLPDLLLDDILDDVPGLAGSGRSEDEGSTKGVDEIEPAVTGFSLVLV